MDGLEIVLSNLPSLGGYGGGVVLLVIAIRMALKADNRYNAEVKEHAKTEKALDDERALRRRVEDEHGEARREVQQLRARVYDLEARQPTGGAT